MVEEKEAELREKAKDVGLRRMGGGRIEEQMAPGRNEEGEEWEPPLTGSWSPVRGGGERDLVVGEDCSRSRGAAGFVGGVKLGPATPAAGIDKGMGGVTEVRVMGRHAKVVLGLAEVGILHYDDGVMRNE